MDPRGAEMPETPPDDGSRAEDRPSSSEIYSAGAVLVVLASKDSHGGRRGIFEEERLMLEDCFDRGKGTPDFAKYHIEAVRKAVKSSNLLMVQLLLSKDSTYQLLCNDPDILQLALRHSVNQRDSESLQTMISVIVHHGAQLNAVAPNGDTALYLTCDYGLPQAFDFLIEAGADSQTLHQRRPIKRTDSGSSSAPAEIQSELNLLQVTLDARLRDEGYGSANTAYSVPLEARYGRIIKHLFYAGMTTAPDDPALSKLLHVACYQGHADYVDMILRHGVDVHAKAARVDDRDIVYGSALHAAAAGGHRNIVMRLLEYGADPRTARLQEYMKPSSPDEMLTPIAAALRHPKFSPRAESQKLLDVCEVILEAGALEADRRLTVLECAKSGRIARLRHLLQPEMVIDQVPLCSNIEAITILLNHGAAIDAKEFQKYAIEEGLVEVMKFLVERFDPLLTEEEVKSSIFKSRPRKGDTESLEYLIRDYGHHASETSSLHGNVATELLRTFFERAKLDVVRSLLQEANKSGCPGVREGTITTLSAMIHQYWFDDYHVHDRMTKDRLQLYQLLLNLSDHSNSSRIIDDSKLWLTPDNLPQHIYDRISTIPTDAHSNSRSSSLTKGFTTKKGVSTQKEPTSKTGPMSKIGSIEKLSFKGKNKTITAEQDDRIDKTLSTSSRNSSDDETATPLKGLRDTRGNQAISLHPVSCELNRGENKSNSTQPDGQHSPNISAETEIPRVPLAHPEVKSDSTFFQAPSPFAGAVHCPLCAKNYGFDYDKLDGSLAMRVVIIEPSMNLSAAIRCRLITTNLGALPKYEALSYVWGELSDPVNIILNGIDFAVTKNLWSALRRLRLLDRERCLWVDAICINQNFLHERNQQVGMMREIYQKSQQTLVWVGEEADDSHLIFEHIKDWTTYRDNYKAGRTKKNNSWGEAHLNMPHYTGNTRAAFESFCRRPYFFRSWTLQEVVVSKQALIICGQHQEKLDLVANGTSFHRGNLYDPFRGESVDTVTHFFELRGLSPNSGFKSVLRYSRFCQASDQRDKVYSLLGLFIQPLITVDYSLDVRTVFRNFTEAIIKEEENIEFLHWLGISERHVRELPSWVPDFTASKSTGILPRVDHHTHVVTAASPSLSKILPGFRIDGPRLYIQGTHLDTIRNIGVALLADPTTYPDSAPFRKIMHNWEEIAAGLIPHKRYAIPVTETFLKTVTGGQSASMSWYLNFGSGTLRNLEEDYFNDYDVLRAWRRDGDGSDKNEEVSLSHFKRQLNECCYGRKLFVTERGSMGLAPLDTRNGDLIVFFSGALYPFVLRSLEDGTFAMMGDCYLFEPRRDSLYYDDFNEHMFYRDNIYRDVTEWVIQ